VQLAPGDVFAGYRVVRRIGTGGMGAVYLVEHPRLPRRDALKLLNRELSAEPDFVARFMREADIVSGLAHRNIVSIYDRGEEAGQLWLTMRYVDGIDAEAAVDQAGGLLPAPRAVHIVTEVAAALDAAHRRHLIHRDVKPANVLLCLSDDDEPEQVFLTDFGIAKQMDASSRLTQTGLVVATFDYASPEQIQVLPLDARSDVYSLGCVLYKLLTGSVPFPGDTMLAAAAGHLSLPPPKATALVPWLAPALDDVIARAMAKNPADRFPTCRALAAAATSAMDQFPAPPQPPYRVFLSRAANGWGPGALLGPMRTDPLGGPEAERLESLVRRTRFFDLPEQLSGASPGQRQVTIEIGCTGRAHRVAVDLDTPRRPPELEDLIATIEQMPTPTPAQRNAPPPPLPPSAVPMPLTGRRAATPSPPEAVVARSGPLPQLQAQSGPRTFPPVRTPLTPPPQPPWTPVPGPAPAPRRRGRGRATLLAVLTAVVVGAGATTWFLVDRDGSEGGGSDAESSATATTAPPPDQATIGGTAALDALPKSTPVGAGNLFVPREVGRDDVDIFLVDVASDTVNVAVTSGPGEDLYPVLSPYRDSLVYLRENPDGSTELRTVGSRGGGDAPLFTTPPSDCTIPGRPAWNPAEPTHLALACYDDENQTTLRIVSLDGEVLHDLTLAPGVVRINDLAFAPDGRRLAYWGSTRNTANAGHLYVQEAYGSGAVDQLTTAGTDNGPVWSPDGETIAFSRGEEGSREIFTIAVDDDEPEPGLVLAADGDSDDVSPAWSPEGDMIAFRSNRAATQQWYVIDADGGDPRPLGGGGRADGSPAWGYR
jgi:hypothetical protein